MRRRRAEAAHADVPVVQVDGRVAVAGHQQHLVAALAAFVQFVTSRMPCSSEGRW